MKKILALVLALMLICGVATASSKRGTLKGNPIIEVRYNDSPLQARYVQGVLLNDQPMVSMDTLKDIGLYAEWQPLTYSINLSLPKKEQHLELSQARLDKISKSVGKITAHRPDGSSVRGTGFAIDGGYFITASHVGHGAEKLQIELGGKQYEMTGQPAFDNTGTDVYGVRLDVPDTLSYVTYPPDLGEIVYGIGYPRSTFEIGKGTVERLRIGEGFLITTSLTYGVSGGPVVNAHGEVVGLATRGSINTQTNETNGNSGSLMKLVQDEIDKLTKSAQ